MKIRAIELTNIRRFAGQTARIDDIGDGVTVLSEPNEFGKSTFFDALHALFFERHRGAILCHTVPVVVAFPRHVNVLFIAQFLLLSMQQHHLASKPQA